MKLELNFVMLVIGANWKSQALVKLFSNFAISVSSGIFYAAKNSYDPKNIWSFEYCSWKAKKYLKC